MGLEIITWEDTTNVAEWQTKDELESFARDKGWVVRNVGWNVYEDEHCVLLAARKTKDEAHFGLAERIPKQCIISRKTII